MVSLEPYSVGQKVRVIKYVFTEGFWERAGLHISGHITTPPSTLKDPSQLRTHLNIFPDGEYPPQDSEFASQHPVWMPRVPVVDVDNGGIVECYSFEPID